RLADAIRRDFDAEALLQIAHAGEGARAAEIVEKRIERGRRPAESEAFAWNEAFEIEAPFGKAFGEAESSRGNDDFGGPAVGGACSAGIPDTVPIERGGLRIGDETVGASAASVDLEKVAGATVAVSVEDDADGVVGERSTVAAHG